MNTRAAIIALIVVIAAAVVAFVLLRPAPVVPPVAPTWLATLNPVLVQRIEVAWKTGGRAELVRSNIADMWMLTEGGESWPVSGSRVNALVRLLGDLEAAPAAAVADASNLVLTVSDGGATQRVVGFSAPLLGGKATAKIEGSPEAYRLADGGLVRLFDAGTLRGWREPRAFISVSGDAADFSRATVQTRDRVLTLARAGGRWAVRSPLVAPASQDACAGMAAGLARLGIARFMDTRPGADETLGLAPAALVIETHTEHRRVEGDRVVRRVLVQSLRIGGNAEPAGKTLWAVCSAQWLDPETDTRAAAWGPVYCTVVREEVAALNLQPEAYIARTAVQTGVADISRVRVMRDDDPMHDAPRGTDGVVAATLERYLEAWQLAAGDAAARAPSPAEQAHIETLLELLCEMPADAQGQEPPTGVQGIALLRVEATGAGGDVGVGVARLVPPAAMKLDTGAREAVVLRVGEVYRVYFGRPAVETARWLRDVVGE